MKNDYMISWSYDLNVKATEQEYLGYPSATTAMGEWLEENGHDEINKLELFMIRKLRKMI